MNFRDFLLLLVFCSLLYSCGQQDFDQALQYQEEGEYNKALAAYKKAIHSDINVDIAFKNSGDIYFSKSDFVKAFDSYRNCIEINPDLALYDVVNYLSYGNKDVRKACTEMLPKIENADARKKLLSKILSMLKSDKQYEKIDALEAILKLGASCESLIDDIVLLLDDPNLVIKQKVLLVLPLMPNQAVKAGALNKIKKILKQNNELVKISAIECLGNMGKASVETLPELIDLTVEDRIFRKHAYNAIKKIGPPSRTQAALLPGFLLKKSFVTKALILSIFSKMGHEANDFVPNIILLLKDDNPKIIQYARETLTKVGRASEKAVPNLILLLNDNNMEVKLRAITELSDMGNKASLAIGPLTTLSKSKDIAVRKYAEEALVKIQKK